MNDQTKKTNVSKDSIKNLAVTLKELSSSYQMKDSSVSDEQWLSEQYRAAFSFLSEKEVAELGRMTVNGVQRFQSTLNDVMEATASGKSREQWFAEKASSQIESFTSGETANQLRVLDQALITENDSMLKDVAVEIDGDEIVVKYSDPELGINDESAGEENPFLLKNTLLNIGQNAVVAGLQTMNRPEITDFTTDALQEVCQEPDDGLKRLAGETGAERLKTLLTAAIKIAVETGKMPILPKVISVDTIANLASHGVEYYTTLSKFSEGKLTLMQAMDHVGLSGVAMLYNIFSSEGIKNASMALLSRIPIIGPVLGSVLGTVISVAIDRNMYVVIREALQRAQERVQSAVQSVWEKVKETGKKIKNTVKNFCSWLFA